MISETIKVVTESISRGQGYWLLIAFIVIVFLAYIFLGIRAIWLLVSVVKPRIIPTTKRESILFFGSIAKMELEYFKEKMRSLDHDTLLNELSDQTYVSSEIAAIKYQYLHQAFNSLSYAFLAGFIAIGVISVAGAILLP